MTPLELPAELNDDDAAIRTLQTYFSPDYTLDKVRANRRGYNGSKFESWDHASPSPPHEFTAADALSLNFLSEPLDARAAYGLLVERRSNLNEMLAKIPSDLDLVDATPDDIGPDSPASRLYDELKRLPEVKGTRASKLLHRKRPRLVPIRDSVVTSRLGLGDAFWTPLHDLLRRDDHALHDRLLRLREQAQVPDTISALRVLDVLLWMPTTAMP